MVSGWPDGWLCAFSGSHKAPPDMAVEPPMRPVFSISSTCKPPAPPPIPPHNPPPRPPSRPPPHRIHARRAALASLSCGDAAKGFAAIDEQHLAGDEAGLRRDQ